MLDSETDETSQRVSDIVERIARQHNISRAFKPTDHLVDSGLTSMAMVDLMLAVEADFDITIPQREMTPTNFQSIASLSAMLDRISSRPRSAAS